MDETKWLVAESAGNMVWTLFSRSSGGGRIKDERFRRFGIACARRAVAALPGGSSPALDLLDNSIATGINDAVLANVRKMQQEQLKTNKDAPFGDRARQWAYSAVLKCAKGKTTMAAMAYEWALGAVVSIRGFEGGWEPAGWPRQPNHAQAEDAEQRAQADLARDIFGNPWRPPIALDPAWRTNTVVAIARQMFDTNDFSAMPILADALQDAGCEDEHILSHCRAEKPHARGCWLVDLVLENRPAAPIIPKKARRSS
jgi:hypothetical protein